jgi:4-carboxymuconolactone decarboxylase
MPPKIRELAMIVTARGTDCQYIWNVHAPTGRREGLSNALVDALKNKQPLPSMLPDEEAVVNLGLEFFSTHRVSQENFQLAWEQFGTQGLVELTTLMGFYAMLAFNANTVGLDPPLEPAEPLMPI